MTSVSPSFVPQTLLPAFDSAQAISRDPVAPSSAFPCDSPPSSPSASSIGQFFTRARSNSLHSLASSASFSRQRSDSIAPPPVPSIPSSFSHSSSDVSRPSRRPSFSNDMSRPHIKNVSVPHYAKSGGKWVYACRVVPDGCAGGSQEAVMVPRTGNLGRMQMAGAGHDGASEPHTVWRTWGEFVDFSSRLSTTFPFVSPGNGAPSKSPSSSEALPSSFYRQTPRLTRKLTLFVTRSTLLQRKDDLDLFVRRLFEMPDVIRRSNLVRDFFRIRENDLGTTIAPTLLSSGESSPTTPLDDGEPGSFAHFLTEVHSPSPNATIRVNAARPKPRPSLPVKHSTPDLRRLMLSDTESIFEAPPRSTSKRPLLSERSNTVDDASVRSSACSSASSATITPATASSASLIRMPSPLSTRSPLPSVFAQAQAAATPAAVAAKVRHQGLLRHFYSLPDLGGQQTLTRERPPLPKSPSSVDMGRAQTQPTFPSTPSSTTMSRAASTGRYHNQQRQRSGSKSSSTSSSSFEDMSGSPYTSSAGAWPAAGGGFRHGPSGRLDRVPETAQHPRRPSTQSRSHSNTKASLGHSPSPSASSIGSTFSSASASDLSRSMSSPGGYFLSRRSSTEYSDVGSYVPGTPPTPHFDGEPCGGKYFVSESGVLSQNNKVPLPPFFPVPPSMASPSSVAMQSAFSNDSILSSPRKGHSRRSSSESMSRATSSASSRPSRLDLVPGSPLSSSMSSASSTSSATSSPSVRPQDRPTLTFKVLHPECNFNLRVPRATTLSDLRVQIERKFAANGTVRIGGDVQWALSYTLGRISGDNVAPAELIASEDDFLLALRRTEHLEKVVLRIIS